MLTNLAVGEDVIPGLRKEDTSSRRKNYTISEPFEESPEKEIKFYINEWDGNEWIRKELVDGDSIIIRNYNQGIEDYYILWTIKNNELCSISKKAINGIVEGNESGVKIIENQLDFEDLYINCGTWDI